MLYSVNIYPRINEALARGIDAIREKYDPSWRLIEPHIGLCFPATKSLDEPLLSCHVEQVVCGWSPFMIRLGGFLKWRDHWLFITLLEGADEIKALNQELYTGYLAPYRKEPTPGRELAPPHIGLGLFIKRGCLYDYRNPRDEDFDQERFDEAMRMANDLPLPESFMVESVHLTRMPDVIAEWTTGKREELPQDAVMVPVREFRLRG